MKTTRNLRPFLIIASLALSVNPIYAQVTIGSTARPRAGALLDLTQGTTTTKGLNLPRVKLSKLKPATPAELAASIGTTGYWELNEHTALVVYNIDACAPEPIEKGMYVFDGIQWQPLKEEDSFITATPAETSQSGNPWGTNIVLHQEKTDAANNVIYKEFFSADFGDAGRWMTTNLAAFQYDGATYTGGDPAGKLNLHPQDNTNPSNRAWYSYPGSNRTIQNNELPSAEFTANHHIGLLYSWDAATAGKGGATGNLNLDNPATGNPSNRETSFPEWDGTGSQPAQTQKRRQGVCPQGWHLPNDYEWTELEQEIVKNTSKYADMADINHDDPTDGGLVVQYTPGIYVETVSRGTAHGTAMKSICPAPNNTTNPAGKSRFSRQNGFNYLLPGFIYDGKTDRYGFGGYFWMSSCSNPDAGWARFLISTIPTMGHESIFRRSVLSVRCKKDN